MSIRTRSGTINMDSESQGSLEPKIVKDKEQVGSNDGDDDDFVGSFTRPTRIKDPNKSSQKSAKKSKRKADDMSGNDSDNDARQGKKKRVESPRSRPPSPASPSSQSAPSSPFQSAPLSDDELDALFKDADAVIECSQDAEIYCGRLKATFDKSQVSRWIRFKGGELHPKGNVAANYRIMSKMMIDAGNGNEEDDFKAVAKEVKQLDAEVQLVQRIRQTKSDDEVRTFIRSKGFRGDRKGNKVANYKIMAKIMLGQTDQLVPIVREQSEPSDRNQQMEEQSASDANEKHEKDKTKTKKSGKKKKKDKGAESRGVESKDEE